MLPALVVATLLTAGDAVPPEVQRIRDDPRLQSQMCAAITGDHVEPLRPVDSFGPDDVASPLEPTNALTTLLVEAREPKLTREGFRATIAAAFIGSMTIRINVHADGSGTLDAKIWPLLGATVPLCRRLTRELTSTDVSGVRRCLDDRAVWTRPKTSNDDDASTWYLEVNDNEGYRTVREWRPPRESPLKRCALMMAKLSRLGFVGLDR